MMIKTTCKKLLELYNDDLKSFIKKIVNLSNLNIPDNIIPDKINNKKEFDKFIETIYDYNKDKQKEVFELIDVLYKLGHCLSTYNNFTLTLSDFCIDKNIIENFRKEVQQTNNIAQKQKILQKYMDQAIEDLKSRDSRIIKIIESGVRANYTQLQQIVLAKGIVDTGLNKMFVNSNYIMGQTIDDFFKAAHGARKAIYDKAISTAKPGYLTRQFIFALHPYEFVTDDCGTNKLLKIRYNNNLKKWFIGKYYLDPLDNKIKLFTKDTEYKFDYILIRSVIFCEQPVCKKCFGEYEFNYLKRIGIITAQTLGERGTQLTLRAFHTASVYDLPKDTSEQISKLSDLVYIDEKTQILYSKKDLHISIPQDLILLKDQSLINKADIHINNNTITLHPGMTLYITKSGNIKENIPIARLNVQSITNIITVLENILRKKIILKDDQSLVNFILILMNLFEYAGSFPLGMIELLTRSLLERKDDKTYLKLSLSMIPHLKGYGLQFERARQAIVYNILYDDNDIEEYPLFKLTDIKGIQSKLKRYKKN